MDLRIYIIVFKHENFLEEVELLGLDKNWAVPNSGREITGSYRRCPDG